MKLERNPDLLLVGQPTRELILVLLNLYINKLLHYATKESNLLISVELDEILSLSDRVLVMFDGEIMGERDPANTNEKELGLGWLAVLRKRLNDITIVEMPLMERANGYIMPDGVDIIIVPLLSLFLAAFLSALPIIAIGESPIAAW